MLLDILNNFGNGRTDLNLIIEQFRLAIVAGLSVVEYMREEDDLKLVEVEGLGDVEEQLVGVESGMVVSHLMQDLVGFVGETAADELPVQLLVAAVGLEVAQPAD